MILLFITCICSTTSYDVSIAKHTILILDCDIIKFLLTMIRTTIATWGPESAFPYENIRLSEVNLGVKWGSCCSVLVSYGVCRRCFFYFLLWFFSASFLFINFPNLFRYITLFSLDLTNWWLVIFVRFLNLLETCLLYYKSRVITCVVLVAEPDHSSLIQTWLS